jgi:hypothetical protein
LGLVLIQTTPDTNPKRPASESSGAPARTAGESRKQGRTSVERVNSRLKVFWGTDDGNITGASRFHACFGVVMVVHPARRHT